MRVAHKLYEKLLLKLDHNLMKIMKRKKRIIIKEPVELFSSNVKFRVEKVYGVRKDTSYLRAIF